MNQSQPKEKAPFEKVKKQAIKQAYKSPLLINYGSVARLTQVTMPSGGQGGIWVNMT